MMKIAEFSVAGKYPAAQHYGVFTPWISGELQASIFCNSENMEDFLDHIRKGNLNEVQLLLGQKPDLLRARDQRGSTPLILAAYYDQVEIVDFLLEHGADADEKDASGNSALMGVCFKGFEQVAYKLIKAGANVNTRNSMGASCLIFAVTFNRENIAKMLLENGADLEARDARGNTALDHARMRGLQPLISLLENR